MTDHWYSRHTAVLDDTKLGKESVASNLRSGLGQYAMAEDTASVGASVERAKLELAQRKLARSVNVLTNANDGEAERTLSIGWSDGSKVNTPGDNTIWLSPADVLKAKDDRAIDALTGQSLLASTMKRTIHRDSWKDAATDSLPTADSTRAIWQALETAVARSEILDSWEGAAPYFARHEAATCASKNEVQAALNEQEPSLPLAATALAWQILHPSDPLKLPLPYEKGIKKALDFLDARRSTADRRYQLCQQVTNLLEIEPSPPPPPQPSPGKGEDKSDQSDKSKSASQGSGSGSGDPGDEKEDAPQDGDPKDDESEEKEQKKQEQDQPSKPESKPEPKKQDPDEDDGDAEEQAAPPKREPKPATPKESKSKPAGPPPSLSDDQLFGQAIPKGKAKPEDLPTPAAVTDEEHDGHEVTMPAGAAALKHGFRVHAVHESDPTIYHAACRRLATQIKAVSEVLRFRNNDPTHFIRGVHSGDLDEGSLDKLTYNEDHPAIWERRELHGQPKIAVGLLLDESGSMGTAERADSLAGSGEMFQARDVAIVLSAALSRIKGMAPMICGHTNAEEHCCKSTWYAGKIPTSHGTLKVTDTGPKQGEVSILEYQTLQHAQPWGLVHANSKFANMDGHAMHYCVKKMLADYPTHPRRILFVISDGQPNDDSLCGGYGGQPAMQHMRSVCEFARRHGIGIYGIGICNAYSQADGELMYGRNNFIVINDVMSSLPILTSYLKNIAARPT